ncbi:MAG: hypothetical protein MUC60_14585 [Oscillatoria sp. Prado101]|nr:hypothetical protein [Oscillatoria sp. Prado101]
MGKICVQFVHKIQTESVNTAPRRDCLEQCKWKSGTSPQFVEKGLLPGQVGLSLMESRSVY